MNKILLLLAIVATSIQADEFAYSEENSLVAMGDIGSIKSSLKDGTSDDVPMQNWNQLTYDQRKILAPLGGEWDSLRPWQREKMLDIAKDYPKMDAQKQLRVQRRLYRWSRMTPFERENARQRYQQFYALSPEKQDEVRKKWLTYQKLPEAERAKLHKDSADLDYDPDLE